MSLRQCAVKRNTASIACNTANKYSKYTNTYKLKIAASMLSRNKATVAMDTHRATLERGEGGGEGGGKVRDARNLTV